MKLFLFASLSFLMATNLYSGDNPDESILTPQPSATPRINGASVFGARPGSPFLYTIPATGDRPMSFSVEGLPQGLTLDEKTGQITGALNTAGEYPVMLHARNDKGEATRKFRIIAGEKIALTPAMGWNSWNCWARSVDQEKVIRSARALVESGLSNHGWTYVNIDDTWQGQRTGKDHALQANEKFPDMKALCDEIHRLGLKAGIYSTPWVTSYAGFAGGSSDAEDGAWSAEKDKRAGYHFGKFPCAHADANQWAAWGFDYLKYDWFPNDLPHVIEMNKALRASGRDIVFSLSNSAPFDEAKDLTQWANSWRTTNDIRDQWDNPNGGRLCSVSEIGFSQDKWAPFAGSGHWNDPDMLVVGYVGWGPQLHLTHLTHDEQYSHISLWCMLSAPLLLGCDLEKLDPFTINLLSNDEVLALDQDALGKQAVRVATVGAIDVFLKELEDGSKALGFFNRGSAAQTLAFGKFVSIGIQGPQHVRDLWRQQDLPDVQTGDKKPLTMTIPSHGVQLYKLTNAE